MYVMSRVYRPLAILFVFVLAVAIGVSIWQQVDNNRARSHVPIIIYLVDTLRADRLGIYGHDYPVSPSPNIDALAVESVVFDAAYSPAPWTLPSVASLITSTWPCEHGLLTSGSKLSPTILTLAERLQGIGYVTAGMYANHLVGPMADLNRGYESFELQVGEYKFAEFSAYTLTQVDDDPLFLYLHSMEPHNFYMTPPWFSRFYVRFTSADYAELKSLWIGCRNLKVADYNANRVPGTTVNTVEQEACNRSLQDIWSKIDRMYDAGITHADFEVGKVIEVLKSSGIWDKAIFIFLSDHGEEFGEHGEWSHEQSVYEELVRVPLIIHFPNDRYAGQRVSEPVALVDIMPTIFDFLAQPDLCDGCRGRSLLSLLHGDSAPQGPEQKIMSYRHNLRTFYQPAKEARGDLNIAIRQDRWKGIWNDEIAKLELYDLTADPAERFDVSEQHVNLAGDLARNAQRWLGECQARRADVEIVNPLDEQQREQLKSMGYLQ